MKKQTFAVIGLGRFGMSIAEELSEAGQEVLGVDMDADLVEDAGEFLTHVIVTDSTDVESLKSIGIRNFDCVICAIGTDMQASILTTLLLKELGVKKVIAKALNRQHGKVLEKIGADWVIYPERDMGQRVARQLLAPNVLNFIELSKEYNIEEIKVPGKMARKTLRDLDLRAKFNISAIAIVKNGEIIISPSPDQVLQMDDILVVVGNRDDLNEFSDSI